MAEWSIFWTTNALGDGAADYTQDELIRWLRTMFAGDEDNEGVCLGSWLDLETTGDASPVSVAAGTALCHGFPYFNGAAKAVAIGTPGPGTTRIDRIVLRATEADREVRIKLHAGVEDAGVPALTQNDGVVWEIPLYQASITDAGVITLTDEREYIHPSIAVKLSMMDANSVDTDQYVDDSIELAHMTADSVDSPQYVDGSVDRIHLTADIVDGTKLADDAVDSEHITDGSVDLGHMSANSVDSDQYVDKSIDLAHLNDECVDDEKVGNRVPAFPERQGGSPVDWSLAGVVDRTPGLVLMQGGSKEFDFVNVAQVTHTITLPQAFGDKPLIFATPNGAGNRAFIKSLNIAAGQFDLKAESDGGGLQTTTISVHWLAIGPKPE